MKLSSIFIIALFFQTIYSVTFTEAMINLRKLESYIQQYKTEKKSSESLTHLILSYIRTGKYTGLAWSIAAGTVPSDLHEYIVNKDKEKKTNVVACREYTDLILPSKEKCDFVHLFATMNGIEYSNSYTDDCSALVGWGGDIAQLIQDIKNLDGTIDQLLVEANKFLGLKGQFGEGDLIADLDAPIILSKKNDSATFADIIEQYYNGDEYKSRIANFVKLTFPSVTDKTQLRQVIFERYNKDSYIPVLECQYGVRDSGLLGCYFPNELISKYKNHQKAAVYAFSDYLKNRF
jgi:hypothetical protein